LGAKQTSNLIPLCHPIQLNHIDVNLELESNGTDYVEIVSSVETEGKTGVEMEALTAVSVNFHYFHFVFPFSFLFFFFF